MLQSFHKFRNLRKIMTTFERRQRILSILREQSSVKVTNLAKLLEVSEGTIRSDLIELDEEQLLLRVRGGAVLKEDFPTPGPGYPERLMPSQTTDCSQR
jgi:DeoR/GlpR family transcriptional regulator of sugar metabolism